jgi:hypothetical protein
MSLSDKTEIKIDNGGWLVLTQEQSDNLNIVVLKYEAINNLVDFLKTNNLIN